MPPIEQSTASLDKLRATASEKRKPPFLKPGNEGNGYTKNEHRDPLILTKTIDQAAPSPPHSPLLFCVCVT